ALPPAAGEAIELLGGLSEDPAGTLFALLEAADVPLDWIPGALRDDVEGWINDYVFDRLYDGAPITEEIARWADDLSAMLTHFEISSELDLGAADAAGGTDANHTLAGVAFDWRGQRQMVDTPAIVDQLTIARDVTCNVSIDRGEAAIDIGDHAFRMPLGDFAVLGFNAGLEQLAGFSDLRDALGSFIDCAGLADDLSSRCLGPVCVGHRDEIESMCLTGIDLAASAIEERIASIDYAELRLSGGRAALAGGDKQDAARATTFDRMEDGTWQAAVDVDGAAVPVGASFTGRRIGASGAPE